MLGALPDEMTGGKRDGDERFEDPRPWAPVLEAAIAAVAKRTDGLTVCRGVAVTGLVTGAESIAGVPHVAGVTVGGATELHADLVIDATGLAMLTRAACSGRVIGARRPDEEKQDCGFVYYARHFRSADGFGRKARERLLQHFEGVSNPHSAVRQRDLGRGLRCLRPGQGAARAPRGLRPGKPRWRCSPASRTGAPPSRSTERAGDRRHRGPAPPVRRRRPSDRDRAGPGRRRLRLHQPLARPGCIHRAVARMRGA